MLIERLKWLLDGIKNLGKQTISNCFKLLKHNKIFAAEL